MEAEIFKTKKFEYKVDNERIEIWKKGRLIAKPKISDFRVLYHRRISEKQSLGLFIFITPILEHSILDQYKGSECDRNIDLLLEKISPQCIMDLKSYWSAAVYTHSQQKKKISFSDRINLVEKKETKCTCSMCSNIWYVSDEKSNKASANVMMGIGNFLSGNLIGAAYNANNIGNPFDCPKCGSSRIEKQTVTFYTDKKGNYVDIDNLRK